VSIAGIIGRRLRPFVVAAEALENLRARRTSRQVVFELVRRLEQPP
jgi:hypothetical protein